MSGPGLKEFKMKMIRNREELMLQYLNIFKENVELTARLVELQNKVREQEQSIASLIQHCEPEMEDCYESI